MMPIVLIHGGGLDSRCWERLLPELLGPVLAIDLPGRGAHPAPLASVDFAYCAASVRDDVDAAGFDSVLLVGHSLAGCSMPAMVALMGQRVAGLVFVACTVPESGHSAFDTLDPDIQAMILAAGEPLEPRPMDPALAKVVLGNDLDDEQFAWCAERLVPEAPRLTTEPVDLSPLRAPMPCTWVRTLRDLIVPAAKQLRFSGNVGNCPVVDIDAGHMCMVSRPVALAEILNDAAA
ncbi:MAG: alpha/beta fold hydrolase [Acidimicrobiales bacterium]|jgi:pimeloyl-ACP methyl ester carboxylesterase